MGSAKYLWLDGVLKPYDDATLHFVSAGLHYGLSVFEGIRCYATDNGPAVFRLGEHVDRLFQSAHIVGFPDLGYTRDQIIAAICETITANGFQDCYIRPLAYLEGAMNMIIHGAKGTLGIATWEWNAFLGKDAMENGIRANISSFTRPSPNVMMTKAKVSGNYVGSLLAKTESKRLGFDEAIMLDPEGYVCECTGENIFVLRSGKIFTPPAANILEGITRNTVITLAGETGLEVSEQRISRDQLYASDEIFVTGTAAEVIGISEVDFRRIGTGRTGPITRQLQEAYHSLTKGKHALSTSYLTYVSDHRAAAAR